MDVSAATGSGAGSAPDAWDDPEHEASLRREVGESVLLFAFSLASTVVVALLFALVVGLAGRP